MQVIKALYGQSLCDLVRDDQLFEAADLNDISITEALVAGVMLSIPEQVVPTLQRERISKKQSEQVIKSIAGQTWIDMAMQLCGDESRLFELCDLNAVSITEDLSAATVVKVLQNDPDKNSIVAALNEKRPSSLYFKTGDPAPEGIEYWAIEIDFIVS